MVTLLYFDIYACSYLLILFAIFGIQVKQKRTIAISFVNIILLRTWLQYFVTVTDFNVTFPNNIQSFLFTIGQGLVEMIICYLIEDFYGYGIHRFMHYNKALYNFVHQQHHRNQADCFITAFDVHFVELTAFYFIGWTIGSYLIGFVWQMSFLGFNMWLFASTFFLVWSHTGLEYKYMPSTRIHNLHHKYYTCNYGTITTDWLFGTIRY